MTVNTAVDIKFNKFWQKQKNNLKELSSNFKDNINSRWAEVVHMTSIVNKWTTRLSETGKVSARMQQVLVGIQIGQTAAAVRMLTIQSAAAFALNTPTGIARGMMLAGFAADMSAEMVFLLTQKASADSAKIESEVMGEAIKNWRTSYN